MSDKKTNDLFIKKKKEITKARRLTHHIDVVNVTSQLRVDCLLF